jgi:hypothetical protein
MPNFRHPAWVIALVLALFLSMAFLVGGFGGWMASGGLVQLFTGLVAAIFYFALLRVSRYLTLTLNPEQASALAASHPLAPAVLSLANYLGAGLVTLAVFGG